MFTQFYNANRIGSRNSQAHGFADKARNIERVAQYPFDFGLRPSGAYVQSNVKDIQGFAAPKRGTLLGIIKGPVPHSSCRVINIASYSAFSLRLISL